MHHDGAGGEGLDGQGHLVRLQMLGGDDLLDLEVTGVGGGEL